MCVTCDVPVAGNEQQWQAQDVLGLTRALALIYVRSRGKASHVFLDPNARPAPVDTNLRTLRDLLAGFHGTHLQTQLKCCQRPRTFGLILVFGEALGESFHLISPSQADRRSLRVV
jgi:hypothetical protein